MALAFQELSELLIYFGVDDVRYLGLAMTDQLDIAGMVWIRKSKITAESITLNIGLRSVKMQYPFTVDQLRDALDGIARQQP